MKCKNCEVQFEQKSLRLYYNTTFLLLSSSIIFLFSICELYMKHLIYIFLPILYFHTSFALIDPSQFINEFKQVMPNCNDAARKWIRTTFHEAGTFDKKDNTGGSDGSLQFELDFPENIGVSSTVEFCQNFVERHPGVSFADTIIFGGKVAVEICNGPIISWQFGRIDSNSPNPRGRLPHPRQSIQELNEIFVIRMGFTKEETVAVILGGHSVARVNHFFGFNDKLGFTDSTPHLMDNIVFKEITQDNLNIVQIPADKNLLQDSDMKNIIANFALDEQLFKSKFKSAFEKLINLGSTFEIIKQLPSPTNTLPAPIVPNPTSNTIPTSSNINTIPSTSNTNNPRQIDQTNSSNFIYTNFAFLFFNTLFFFL